MGAVFEQKQDSIILQGSLFSAVEYLKEEKPHNGNNLIDHQKILRLITEVVQKITISFTASGNHLDNLEKQLHIHRRLHSIMFFMALRSQGIVCEEANEYYTTILHTFPSMEWEFYIKLNFQCNWSEYFLECAQQLPSDVLSVILKKTLQLECTEESLKYYSWHVVLQAIIWKFCIHEDSSLLESKDYCRFDFPFVNNQSSDSNTDDSSSKSQLLHSFVTVLNRITEDENDVCKTKVALHGFKTLFRLLGRISTCEGDYVKDVIRITKLESLVTVQHLKKLFSSDSSCTGSAVPCYQTMSWEIDGTSLAFFLISYIQCLQKIGSLPESPLSPIFPTIMSSITALRTDLISSCPLFESSFEASTKKYHENLLKDIIVYQLPHFSCAAKIILIHPEIWETDGMLDVLEDNISVISPLETYAQFVDAVLIASSLEIKTTFLKLLYKILSLAPTSTYNKAIQYILTKYDYNDHFKLPDFDMQLTQLKWKSPSLEEAVNYLPLFVQSPQLVLKSVISEAMYQGSEGMVLIKMLKDVQFLCHHIGSEDTMPALLLELLEFLRKSEVEPYVTKHLPLLIQTVMEVQLEADVISFDMYLKECIIPNLEVKKNNSCLLTLNCLNVALEVILSDKDFHVNDDILDSLILTLAELLDFCITTGNGNTKEIVLDSFKLLGTYLTLPETKTEITNASFWSSFDDYHPAVPLYVFKFLQKVPKLEISHLSVSELFWTWCCITEDMKLFKEKISLKVLSYEDLLHILVPVLNHFSKTEWIQSACLLEEYLKHVSYKDEFLQGPWLLAESDSQLLAVIECLIDSTHFLFEENSSDHVISCLANTVLYLLQRQDVSPELLVNVSMDLCHLASSLEADVNAISSLLIQIHKDIVLNCKDESLLIDYKIVLLENVKCLPDSNEKNALMQNFKKGL